MRCLDLFEMRATKETIGHLLSDPVSSSRSKRRRSFESGGTEKRLQSFSSPLAFQKREGCIRPFMSHNDLENYDNIIIPR